MNVRPPASLPARLPALWETRAVRTNRNKEHMVLGKDRSSEASGHLHVLEIADRKRGTLSGSPI